MSEPSSALTPQQRLTLSRKAIVRHMHKDDRPERPDAIEYSQVKAQSAAEADVGEAFGENPRSVPDGTWSLITQAFRSWWHHHPANIAVEIATPFLSNYAKAHPARLVGIAAGVGAAAVVFKTWRLVSVGGILLAVMKSADISAVVMSVMSGSRKNSAGPPMKADAYHDE